MKNNNLTQKLILIPALLIFLLLRPKSVSALSVAGNSATMQSNYISGEGSLYILKKRLAIRKVLEKYNSPLADNTDAFISTCMQYNLNCYLLPSITGLESSFGQFIWPGSYNPFGWGRGYIPFASWSAGIDTVGKGLRENYLNKGADSVEKIAPIYSESKTWAPRVESFMDSFAEEERKIGSILSENTVKL